LRRKRPRKYRRQKPGLGCRESKKGVKTQKKRERSQSGDRHITKKKGDKSFFFTRTRRKNTSPVSPRK